MKPVGILIDKGFRSEVQRERLDEGSSALKLREANTHLGREWSFGGYGHSVLYAVVRTTIRARVSIERQIWAPDPKRVVMGVGQRITSVGDVPSDTTFLFTIRDRESGEEDEAILTRRDGEVKGWINRCMHFRHIRLDKGSGAPKRNGELVCANHGALFEDDTGLCTYGPCEGAYLEGIEIDVRDRDVYLIDDNYEFVDEGGLEKDPVDLSSKSNIEF